MKPPPSASGAKKKAYYLEDAMQFCLPFMKTSAPPLFGNLPQYSDANEGGVDEETPQDNASYTDFSHTVPSLTSQASKHPMSDQELNVKFVGEVEKHEELYNYKLPAYSRKDMTEKAWQMVGAEVNMSGKGVYNIYFRVYNCVFFTKI